MFRTVQLDPQAERHKPKLGTIWAQSGSSTR